MYASVLSNTVSIELVSGKVLPNVVGIVPVDESNNFWLFVKSWPSL